MPPRLHGLLATSVIILALASCSAEPPKRIAVDRTRARQYTFTSDWHSWNSAGQWEIALKPYAGKPAVRYLEIGVYEGRSFLWMLDNVLTHPDSRAVAVDLFADDTYPDLEQVFRANLKQSGHAGKADVRCGLSQNVLRTLTDNAFDVVYIDGSHRACDVFVDLALSWLLLKDGGLLILDDYGNNRHWPTDLRPQASIDAFLSAFRNEIEVLHSKYQIILRKRTRPDEAVVWNSTVFVWNEASRWHYNWTEKKLYIDGRTIPLNDQQQRDLRNLILEHDRLLKTAPSMTHLRQTLGRLPDP